MTDPETSLDAIFSRAIDLHLPDTQTEPPFRVAEQVSPSGS